MSWKDYLYFDKGERIAILLLLVLIVITGSLYILTKDNRTEVPSPEVEQAFEIQQETKDKESETAPQNKQRTNTIRSYPYQEKLKIGETIELNKADTTSLKKIPGIGSGYANRIVKYRNLLGGYISINQLKEVWGVDDELYAKITPYLTVVGTPKRLNINTSSFKELNKHPYISYEQTKIVVNLRERKGRIESIDRLALLDEFTEGDLKRLEAYITFD